MSYQVLARKWRPRTFADVVGQEHILTALTNSLTLGRIHHAYLLSGTRGVGKTTIARLLAKGLNCKIGITATPCCQCDNCHEIEKGSFIDLIEIDAASRTKVEDTRDLLDNVQYAPVRGNFKVYLIDEVHMLSRHSFNALLKTLEETPAHVKFLLATTDPQKLPVTILSRCLQFHLKSLDVEQICGQLSTVLQQEHIVAAPRALQLLARAADGSMRDAMNLADQAITIGHGEISTEAVSLMLGTLNTEQPLALIEALVDADGGAMMAQLAQYTDRGMDWETLLLEMLSLLHRLAMGQLLPDQFNYEEDHSIVLRLRELARRLSPEDLQLYYQTLLIGRKELSFAPNPRMGVEMTLLRALAFHPAVMKAAVISTNAEKKTAEFGPDTGQNKLVTEVAVASEVASVDQVTLRVGVNISSIAKYCPGATSDIATLVESKIVPSSYDNRAADISAPVPILTSRQTTPLLGRGTCTTKQATVVNSTDKNIIEVEAYTDSKFNNDKVQAEWQPMTTMPENTDSHISTLGRNSSSPGATAQLLQARATLLRHKEKQKIKNAKPACQKTTISTLERIIIVGERIQKHKPTIKREDSVKALRLDAQWWRNSQQLGDEVIPMTTSKMLRTSLEHEKTPKLALSLAEEVLGRDSWAVQVHRLAVPKLVMQFALNTWKEDLASNKICLHLRTSQRHLNSTVTQNALRAALSADLGTPVKLTVVEDDNPAIKTPLEWRQVIYEEKLMQARNAMMNDSHIQILQRFFDAELDEDSIRPI